MLRQDRVHILCAKIVLYFGKPIYKSATDMVIADVYKFAIAAGIIERDLVSASAVLARAQSILKGQKSGMQRLARIIIVVIILVCENKHGGTHSTKDWLAFTHHLLNAETLLSLQQEILEAINYTVHIPDNEIRETLSILDDNYLKGRNLPFLLPSLLKNIATDH